MKKIRLKLFFRVMYCTAFFALILAPFIFMPWDSSHSAENRPLAPAPEFFENGRINPSAPMQAEAYFNDRFAGRTRMIDTYSRFIGNVFELSVNDKVIMGTDGWLFFHETAGDYDGRSALGDADMAALTERLLQIEQTARLRGQVFIIAVAPNKNTLYGNYMPSRYRKSDNPSNLDRLLEIEELKIVDLVSALDDARLKSGQILYYKTDSHWNSTGALVAAEAIISVIDEYAGIDRSDEQLPGNLPGDFEIREFPGDLGQMLYPLNAPVEEEYVYSKIQERFSFIGRYRGPDDMNITTQSDGAPVKVAMYRDSFANSLIPFISAAYKDVYYTRQTPPILDNGAFAEADVIIFEIAERRLSELIEW